MNNDEVVQAIKDGGLVVLPTDTIYGIVGGALGRDVVEHLYAVRKRELDNPFLLLVSSLEMIEEILGRRLAHEEKDFLETVWQPGERPTTVILRVAPGSIDELAYLHRQRGTLAVRLPVNKPELVEIISKTGPLVAPSANLAGEPYAVNIKQAKEYFGNQAAVYIDAGDIVGTPSRLVEVTSDGVFELRS